MHTPQLIPTSHAQITNRVSHRVKTSPPIALRSLLVIQVTDTTSPQNAQTIEQVLTPASATACSLLFSPHGSSKATTLGTSSTHQPLKLELRVSHDISLSWISNPYTIRPSYQNRHASPKAQRESHYRSVRCRAHLHSLGLVAQSLLAPIARREGP
jgi:hypothetical protein